MVIERDPPPDVRHPLEWSTWAAGCDHLEAGVCFGCMTRAVREAVEMERESCARVAAGHDPQWVHPSAGEDYIAGDPMADIAAAIRQRQ